MNIRRAPHDAFTGFQDELAGGAFSVDLLQRMPTGLAHFSQKLVCAAAYRIEFGHYKMKPGIVGASQDTFKT